MKDDEIRLVREPRVHDTTSCLNEEGAVGYLISKPEPKAKTCTAPENDSRYVKPDEQTSQGYCLNAANLLLRQVIPYRPAEDHVHTSVDP